uniref:Putative secreted protein n=1 Tax=Ixodes ricinus TaxID=34613 RepID=A0A6B0URQ4_IXORI
MVLFSVFLFLSTAAAPPLVCPDDKPGWFRSCFVCEVLRLLWRCSASLVCVRQTGLGHFFYQDAQRCRRFLRSDRVPHYEKTLRSKRLPPTKSKAARRRPFSRSAHDDIPRTGKGSRRRRRNTQQRMTSLIEA